MAMYCKKIDFLLFCYVKHKFNIKQKRTMTKTIIYIILVLLTIQYTTSLNSYADTTSTDSYKNNKIKKYNRKNNYADTTSPDSYKNNKINEYNRKNNYAVFGDTIYSNLTTEQFKIYHNLNLKKTIKTDRLLSLNCRKNYVNKSINWVLKGAVTPVKNQKKCGSCWAFSTTGNIESKYFIKNKELISLSEQELVSCSTNNNGCNGGSMDNAFEWLIKTNNGHIMSENKYLYVSGNNIVPPCNKRNYKNTRVSINSYLNLLSDECIMSNYLYNFGPISIGVDASSWQYYVGGVLTNCESTQIDHGVLLVGFDDFNIPPYWLIKNSWSDKWGENGYIRVSKWTNQCLLNTAPSTSIIK